MNTLFDDVDYGAEFSPCRKYRYKLWRIWDKSKPLAMCIGLNPPTANANKNDQTIRYLMQMLPILDYGGFYMTNLFALISSKPEALLDSNTDTIKDNDIKLAETHLLCKDVIVCWGTFQQATARIKEVLPRYPDALCFGINNNGTPFHPLAMMPRNGRDSNKPKLIKYLR